MRDENDTPLTEEELELARRGESLIAAAVAEVEAPQSLRERIEADRAKAQAAPPVPFWRRRSGVLAFGGAAAAVVAVTIALSTGSDEPPSLAKVQATAQLAATDTAPAPVGGTPPNLDAGVGDLRFPDWEKKFKWRAVGQREDEGADRDIYTVFYRNPKGAELGYSVVSGDELTEKPRGRRVERDGKTYWVDESGRKTIVTWQQQGHTCVMVAPNTVAKSKLVDLAASRNV